MLRNDSILLTYDIQKMKFRGNLGSILDFFEMQIKVNFKMTASQYGLFFKFYFHKGKSILIIPGRTCLWTLEFVILF